VKVTLTGAKFSEGGAKKTDPDLSRRPLMRTCWKKENAMFENIWNDRGTSTPKSIHDRNA